MISTGDASKVPEIVAMQVTFLSFWPICENITSTTPTVNNKDVEMAVSVLGTIGVKVTESYGIVLLGMKSG